MVTIGLAAIVCIGVLIIWLIYTYNRFVLRQTRIDTVWDEVDKHLKLRHELIPHLIEAADGRMQDEAPLFRRIEEIRASVKPDDEDDDTDASETEPLENELSTLLRKLRGSANNYPELMMDQKFITTLGELVSMEGRASTACEHHNDLVREFNRAIQCFPANLIVGFLHFKPCEMRIFGAPEKAAN
jgi:LemA protein